MSRGDDAPPGPLGSDPEPRPFALKDCALVALATGRRAQNLKELRDHLLTVSASSLYYHFWGGLLHPGFEERAYANDLAEWVHQSLHDTALAERLAVIDPSDFADLEAMREELLEAIEAHLDQASALAWVPVDRQFQFVRSQIVVFDTRRSVARPEDLTPMLATLSAGSVFYHFIDARQRLPEGSDDFRAWLAGWGEPYRPVRDRLGAIDPYFTTLHELRAEIAIVFAETLGGET